MLINRTFENNCKIETLLKVDFYICIMQTSTVFLVFTQSQETQKTIDIADMLVSQTKKTIKTLLFRREST